MGCTGYSHPDRECLRAGWAGTAVGASGMSKQNVCGSCLGTGDCSRCHGDGECPRCHGFELDCPVCFGTNVCPNCEGTGRCEVCDVKETAKAGEVS